MAKPFFRSALYFIFLLSYLIPTQAQIVDYSKGLETVTAASEKQLDQLPEPDMTPKIPKLLTLEDAILLALRNNPDVQSSEFQRISDKYSLELAYYAYEPQYTLTGNLTTARGQPLQTRLNAGANINSTFGTQTALGLGWSGPNGINTQSINVVQPLLRGYGQVNLIPLENARDQEESAKLNFKNSVITIVSAIINDYYTVVQDLNNLRTQLATLKTQIDIVNQYKLQVSLGKMARSDLLQQESTLATTRLSTQIQQNQLEQDYQQLLGDIGLSPRVQFKIDQKINLQEYEIPTDNEAINMALAGNIAYQQALLALRITKRVVLQAENNQLWQLNATGNVSMTNGKADTATPSLSLDLDVPIADVSLKAQLVQAKVALMQAQLALQNQKRQLINSVINGLIQLRNQVQTIRLSKNAVDLLADSLQSEQIKLKYGKSTVFNVTQLQNQVLSQQIDLIDQEITYQLNITSFQVLLGQTLTHWKINIRYYSKDAKIHHNFYRY